MSVNQLKHTTMLIDINRRPNNEDRISCIIYCDVIDIQSAISCITKLYPNNTALSYHADIVSNTIYMYTSLKETHNKKYPIKIVVTYSRTVRTGLTVSNNYDNKHHVIIAVNNYNMCHKVSVVLV
jgi:hypothetical protein